MAMRPACVAPLSRHVSCDVDEDTINAPLVYTVMHITYSLPPVTGGFGILAAGTSVILFSASA